MRTLFMVGDFKQAIYGFQGTDPRRFQRGARKVREQRRRSSAPATTYLRRRRAEFRDLSIAASFRRRQPVLDVVDAVIGDGRLRDHGAAGAAAAASRASSPTAPGRSSCGSHSPSTMPDESDEGEERWVVAARPALRRERSPSGSGRWLDEAPVLASTGRPLTAGDILVLVRSRGELASLIVARLFCGGRAGRGHRPAAPA